jgi:hypothetical protein
MLAGGPAFAQLVLPGAAPVTTPGGVYVPVAPSTPLNAPKPILPPKAVSENSIDGKTLLLNGTRGRLTVEKRDKASLTVRFIAVGDMISRPGESCGVDLGNGQPITLAAAATRPQGVARYELPMPGCPVSLDVLDGGLYVSGITQACEFRETDCKVDPRGVWGPAPAGLEGSVDAIEKDRARADKAVRDAYKALIAKVPKTDKAGVRQVASEQAGFTSERELVCRDYAREAVHGYCAARYTELRASSLAVRLNPAASSSSAEAEVKPKPKSRPRVAPDPGGTPRAAPVQQNLF